MALHLTLVAGDSVHIGNTTKIQIVPARGHRTRVAIESTERINMVKGPGRTSEKDRGNGRSGPSRAKPNNP